MGVSGHFRESAGEYQYTANFTVVLLDQIYLSLAYEDLDID